MSPFRPESIESFELPPTGIEAAGLIVLLVTPETQFGMLAVCVYDMVMSEMALPTPPSVEVVLMVIEPPEAFTLTIKIAAEPLPSAFEGVIVSVVLPTVVGVPESTHVVLSERPSGSPVLLHEVGAPKPASIVGESELISAFCTR
jgi:hypothetical protein